MSVITPTYSTDPGIFAVAEAGQLQSARVVCGSGLFGLNPRLKEVLINSNVAVVRQAHHERNQQVTVRPELVEGLNQRFLDRLNQFPGRY